MGYTINNNGDREFVIQEEAIKTGGHYQARSVSIDIPATQGWLDLTGLELSFNFPISLLSAEIHCRPEHDQDQVKMHVAPDTTIGVITSDVAVDDTVISVSPTVIANLQLGYCVSLYDGTNKTDCLCVTDINEETGTITVASPSIFSFSATTPTYVLMSIEMVPLIELTANHRIVLGESKIGGSYIPTGTVLKLLYHNTDGVAKRFSIIMEYLY